MKIDVPHTCIIEVVGPLSTCGHTHKLVIAN